MPERRRYAERSVLPRGGDEDHQGRIGERWGESQARAQKKAMKITGGVSDKDRWKGSGLASGMNGLRWLVR
jgi:hypothetical protein